MQIDLKCDFLWENSNLIKIYNYQKRTKQSFGLSLSNYNRICMIDINAHNDQGCSGIEPTLLS